MTLLTIESSPWHRNDFAVPYPTYFHPSNDNEVFQWQNRMRRQRRRFLFSFAGAPRPNLPDSIRNQIIDQCSASRRKCKLLECGLVGSKCHTPVNVMKMFQSSVFCLQPPGDSYTRRSVFDSILAGCIPVFFHPGSAYVQYLWHLPKNYTKYSVFIPGNSIKSGNASIEKILHRIPREEVVAMREEVIRLISKVIYANPKSRLETLEDAFDIAVKAVLERVETVRRDMREGRNSSLLLMKRCLGSILCWGQTLLNMNGILSLIKQMPTFKLGNRTTNKFNFFIVVVESCSS
ncbi:putative xyloglucan galactosyltransferase GT11 [Vitis vinifera]|uniref:Putative xyloglucan galactosyltransferase GT11 n=1 Tax=Vitis vinifera TaxID=29760 RepID=A0A438G0T1_VITVI|nr:putative xyloglucan galactosyltransferase GT11 [Vitis vinifera]